jgi:hypothetical protein
LTRQRSVVKAINEAANGSPSEIHITGHSRPGYTPEMGDTVTGPYNLHRSAKYTSQVKVVWVRAESWVLRRREERW